MEQKFEIIFFVFCGLFALTFSMPAINDDIHVVKYHNEKNADGSYSFNYELDDGQSRTEKGTFKDGKDVDGNDIKILTVTGQYSFIAPSGEKFITYYVADENGYRVQKSMTEANDDAFYAVDDRARSDDEIIATTITTEATETETEIAS